MKPEDGGSDLEFWKILKKSHVQSSHCGMVWVPQHQGFTLVQLPYRCFRVGNTPTYCVHVGHGWSENDGASKRWHCWLSVLFVDSDGMILDNSYDLKIFKRWLRMVVLSSQIGLKLWVWSRLPRDVAKLEDVSDRNVRMGGLWTISALQTSKKTRKVFRKCVFQQLVRVKNDEISTKLILFLGGGFNYFLFSALFGEMIQFH